MIVFDLKCRSGHVFEAWFSSSSAYEEQRANGIVFCPECGTSEITKAPMAPNISTGRRRETPVDQASPEPSPASTSPVASIELADEVRAALRTLKEKVEREFDYVGPRFAEEARRIHYGESDTRPIYGEASLEETRELLEEGVEVLPLPFQKQDA